MERERCVVSPAVLQRALSGFTFDPSVVKNVDFEDYVEGPVPLAGSAIVSEEATIRKSEDEELDALLLEASQQFEASQQQQQVITTLKLHTEQQHVSISTVPEAKESRQYSSEGSSACSTGRFGVPLCPMDIESVKQSRVPLCFGY